MYFFKCQITTYFVELAPEIQHGHILPQSATVHSRAQTGRPPLQGSAIKRTSQSRDATSYTSYPSTHFLYTQPNIDG